MGGEGGGGIYYKIMACNIKKMEKINKKKIISQKYVSL